MTDAKTLHGIDGHCPECHAVLSSGAERCWLCERAVTPPADVNPYASPAVGEYSYSLSSLLIVVTFVAVNCGLFLIAPGLAILAAVLATPALLRTMLVVHQRARRGKSADATTKLSLFFVSFMVTGLLLSVVCVVACGTFFVTCLGGLESSGGSPRSLNSVLTLAGFCSLIATGATMALLSKWVVNRWQRDTQT